MLRIFLLLLTFITGCSTYYPEQNPSLGKNLQLQAPSLDPVQKQVARHYQTELIFSAQALINNLSNAQKQKILLEYKNPYRTRGFCYVLAHCKTDYVGLRIRDLSPNQKILLNGFLMKALSHAGYDQAIKTLNREWLIEEMETAYRANPKEYPVIGSKQVPNWQPPKQRGGPDFYFAFFGQPTDKSPWAIRFEGHHLSINLSFGPDGEVGFAPLFFGSSPMTVPAAPKFDPNNNYKIWTIQEGQQSLRRESWLSRSFLRALNTEQRLSGKWFELPQAELSGGTAQAPQESPAYKLAQTKAGTGIDGKHLTPLQKQLLIDFLSAFSSVSQSNQITKTQWLAQLTKSKIWWFGDWTDEQAPFYFRVQTPRYLVELLQSNTFGVTSAVEANHVHAAFRDLSKDWDYDILLEHLNHHHQTDENFGL